MINKADKIIEEMCMNMDKTPCFKIKNDELRKNTKIVKGGVYVFAAQPKFGVRRVVHNLTIDCLNDNSTVLYYSKSSDSNKVISDLVNIDKTPFENIKNTKEDFEKIKDYDLYIDDSNDLSVTKIESDIKELKGKGKLDLIVIDPIYDTNKSQSEMYDSIKLCSKIKEIATENNVPIICVAPLYCKELAYSDCPITLIGFRHYAQGRFLEDNADYLAIGAYEDFVRQGMDTMVELNVFKNKYGPCKAFEYEL